MRVDEHPYTSGGDPGASRSDFAKAFTDGATLADRFGADVTASVVHLGDLVIRTGRVVACDPFGYWGLPFTQQIPAGVYPVYGSIVAYGDGDRRTACIMLQFTDARPIRWEMAITADQDRRALREGELYGYVTESGTGCLMDDSLNDVLLSDAGIRDADNQLDLVVSLFEDLHDKLRRRLEVSDIMSATITASTVNLIAFNSGWGDGLYASYVGYDAANEMACLVTDFQVVNAAE